MLYLERASLTIARYDVIKCCPLETLIIESLSLLLLSFPSSPFCYTPAIVPSGQLMSGFHTDMYLVPKVFHLPLSWPSPTITAVIVAIIVSLMATPTSQQVDPQTTLGCHLRSYHFRVDKPTITKRSTGEVLQCSGSVSVKACWGRCGSSEVGTYQMPYRLSNHHVCTYTGTVTRRVKLTECQGYPDPYIDVFDAEGCICQTCKSDYTSCDTLTE